MILISIVKNYWQYNTLELTEIKCFDSSEINRIRGRTPEIMDLKQGGFHLLPFPKTKTKI